MTAAEDLRPAATPALADLPAQPDARSAELRRIAEAAGAALEGAQPQDILRWAFDVFGDGIAIASSMGDATVIDMASKIHPGVPVVFLDTGYHFAETIGTRDAVETVYPVRMLTLTPKQTVPEQDASEGKDLFARDPDRCCALRKVEPLQRGLAPFTAWISGIRRDEAETRRDIKVVEWDAKRAKVKVNPLAAWTQEQVDAYVEANGVLVNPLAEEGYASIGCWPCTRAVAEGEDARAGRWVGRNKTECGLHL